MPELDDHVYFPLRSIFWIYSFGLMGGKRCLPSADVFKCQNNCQSEPLDPDEQGKGTDRKIRNYLAPVHRNSGYPVRKRPSFLWSGGFVVNSLSQGCDFPSDWTLFSQHVRNMALLEAKASGRIKMFSSFQESHGHAL